MRQLVVSTAFVAALCITAGRPAHAQDVYSVTGPTTSPVTTMGVMDHFGRSGQLFMSGKTDLNLLYSHLSFADGTGQNLVNFEVNPGFGLFFQDFMFVKLDLTFGVTSDPTNGLQAANDNKVSTLTVAPGLGVNVPMSALTSFAPSISVAYTYAHASSTGQNRNGLGITVDLPFVFEVAKHLSLTVGPRYFQTLISKQSALAAVAGPDAPSDDLVKYSNISIAGGVIGWF